MLKFYEWLKSPGIMLKVYYQNKFKILTYIWTLYTAPTYLIQLVSEPLNRVVIAESLKGAVEVEMRVEEVHANG